MDNRMLTEVVNSVFNLDADYSRPRLKSSFEKVMFLIMVYHLL